LTHSESGESASARGRIAKSRITASRTHKVFRCARTLRRRMPSDCSAIIPTALLPPEHWPVQGERTRRYYAHWQIDVNTILGACREHMIGPLPRANDLTAPRSSSRRTRHGSFRVFLARSPLERETFQSSRTVCRGGHPYIEDENNRAQTSWTR